MSSDFATLAFSEQSMYSLPARRLTNRLYATVHLCCSEQEHPSSECLLAEIFLTSFRDLKASTHAPCCQNEQRCFCLSGGLSAALPINPSRPQGGVSSGFCNGCRVEQGKTFRSSKTTERKGTSSIDKSICPAAACFTGRVGGGHRSVLISARVMQ